MADPRQKTGLPLLAAFWPGLLGLLILGAAGCTPKRITTSQPATPLESPQRSAPTPAKSASAGSDLPGTRSSDPTGPEPGRTEPDLPEPAMRGKSGILSPGVTPQNLQLGLEAATLARQQLGKQYQWGAAGPDRFDCSGLVQYVFGNLGINLPRVSREQAAIGVAVSASRLQPGDLLFFALSGSVIDHVAIYIGRGEFVHAPRRYQPVRTDSLNNAWWKHRLKSARRLG